MASQAAGILALGHLDPQTASIEVVKEAIRCLYIPTTPKEQRDAVDRFLQQFQQSQHAWAISDTLISENPFESSEAYQRVFFGAITMHNKIRYDFKDVPDALIPTLRDTLLKHIARLNDGLVAVAAALSAAASSAPLAAQKISVGMVRKLVSRLCLSYAALVVQSNESGESVIATIGQTFPPATHGHILLEVLAALPDEGTSQRVLGKTQRRENEFLTGLKSMSPFVLPLVNQMLGVAASTSNAPLVATCFHCFGAWSLYVGLDPDSVAASPVIDFLIATVSAGPEKAGNAALAFGNGGKPPSVPVATAASSDLWDMSYNALQDLIRCYHWENPQHLGVMAKLVPGIVRMTPLFDAATENEDDDICTALSYLFTEAARKSLWGLILQDHSFPPPGADAASSASAPAAAMDGLRKELMDCMIKVTAHRDETIGSKPFPFWIDLGRGFERMADDMQRHTGFSVYSDEATLRTAPLPVQQRIRSLQSIRALLVPVIELLTGVFIQRLRYPEDFDTLESDKKDFFKHDYRYDVADVLAKCCCVILDGPAVVNILHQRLSNEVQRWVQTGNTDKGWEGTEAALYALRCIHRVIPANESVVMPYVFGMLPSLPLLQHADLRATAFRIVDKFHYWLKQHAGSHLGSMFDFVVRYGLLPHPDAVPTPGLGGAPPSLPITLPASYQENACLAINRLGTEFPIELRDQLLALPSRVNLLCLQRENALQVTAAIMQAVFVLDANQHEGPLASILGPIVTLLQRVAADPAAAVHQAAADGTLLASMVTQDALFHRDTCTAFRTTESALQRLLNEARSRHGPFTFDPAALPVDQAAAFLVGAQLWRLAEICYCIGDSKKTYVRLHELHDPKEGTPEDLALTKHQQETIPLPSPSHSAANAGGQPGLLNLPPGERRRRRIEEAAFASSMSIEASLLRLFEAMWPALSAVANVMKGHPEVRNHTMRVLNFALRKLRVRPGRLFLSMVEVVELLHAEGQGTESALHVAKHMVLSHMHHAEPETRARLLMMVGSMLSKVFERVQSCQKPHPAGFNEDRPMIGATLELATTTMNLAPDEMLSPASPIMDNLTSFALAAMDAAWDPQLAPYILSFFASFMHLGKLPREELYGGAGGAGAGGAGSGLLPTPTHTASGMVPPGGASVILTHEQERQRNAERRARRPRVVALLSRIAEHLTKSIVKAVLKTWPDVSIRGRHGDIREGLAEILHTLFVQYFPALDASGAAAASASGPSAMPTNPAGVTGCMPQWALQAFQEDGVCVERGKPTDTEKMTLVGRLFAMQEGGSLSATMVSSDRMAHFLTEMHDAARGVLRQPQYPQGAGPTPSSVGQATVSSGAHTFGGYAHEEGGEEEGEDEYYDDEDPSSRY